MCCVLLHCVYVRPWQRRARERGVALKTFSRPSQPKAPGVDVNADTHHVAEACSFVGVATAMVGRADHSAPPADDESQVADAGVGADGGARGDISHDRPMPTTKVDSEPKSPRAIRLLRQRRRQRKTSRRALSRQSKKDARRLNAG